MAKTSSLKAQSRAFHPVGGMNLLATPIVKNSDRQLRCLI